MSVGMSIHIFKSKIKTRDYDYSWEFPSSGYPVPSYPTQLALRAQWGSNPYRTQFFPPRLDESHSTNLLSLKKKNKIKQQHIHIA